MELPNSCKDSSSHCKSKKRKHDRLQQKGSMNKYFKQNCLFESSDVGTVKTEIDSSPAGRRLKSKGNSPLKHFYSPIKGCEVISIDSDLTNDYQVTPEKKKELPKESGFTLRSPLSRMNGPSKKRVLDTKEVQTKESRKLFSEFPDCDIDDIIADITTSKRFKPSYSPDKKALDQKPLKTSNTKFRKTSSLPLIKYEKMLGDVSPTFPKKSSSSKMQNYPKKDKSRTFIKEENSTEKILDLCSPIAKDVELKKNFTWMKNDSTSSNHSSTPLKKDSDLRKIVRRSRNNVEENEVMSIASSSKRGRKFTVLPDEIQSASQIAFHQTYKDLETFLELKNCSQTCPNFERAMQSQRQPLSNRYNVNFNFHMGRNNQQLMALGSLRRLSCRFYPIASNIHDVIFKIVEVILPDQYSQVLVLYPKRLATNAKLTQFSPRTDLIKHHPNRLQ